MTTPSPSYHELLEAIRARDLVTIERLSGVRIQSADLLDGIDEETSAEEMLSEPKCECGRAVDEHGMKCRGCEELDNMYDAADFRFREEFGD